MSCGTSLAEASNRDGARALAREPDGPAAPEPARPGRSGCLRTGRARPSRAGAPGSPRSRDLRGVFLCESRRRRALRQATPTRAPHWIPARCPPTDPEPSREPRRPSPSTHGPSPLERAPGLSPGRLRHVDLRLGPGHGGPPPALFGPRRIPPQGGPPRPHRRRRPAGRTRGAGNVDGSPSTPLPASGWRESTPRTLRRSAGSDRPSPSMAVPSSSVPPAQRVRLHG